MHFGDQNGFVIYEFIFVVLCSAALGALKLFGSPISITNRSESITKFDEG